MEPREKELKIIEIYVHRSTYVLDGRQWKIYDGIISVFPGNYINASQILKVFSPTPLLTPSIFFSFVFFCFPLQSGLLAIHAMQCFMDSANPLVLCRILTKHRKRSRVVFEACFYMLVLSSNYYYEGIYVFWIVNKQVRFQIFLKGDLRELRVTWRPCQVDDYESINSTIV